MRVLLLSFLISSSPLFSKESYLITRGDTLSEILVDEKKFPVYGETGWIKKTSNDSRNNILNHGDLIFAGEELHLEKEEEAKAASITHVCKPEIKSEDKAKNREFSFWSGYKLKESTDRNTDVKAKAGSTYLAGASYLSEVDDKLYQISAEIYKLDVTSKESESSLYSLKLAMGEKLTKSLSWLLGVRRESFIFSSDAQVINIKGFNLISASTLYRRRIWGIKSSFQLDYSFALNSCVEKCVEQVIDFTSKYMKTISIYGYALDIGPYLEVKYIKSTVTNDLDKGVGLVVAKSW